jgi:hypothetical protein
MRHPSQQNAFVREQQYLAERALDELDREVEKFFHLGLPPTQAWVERREWEFDFKRALTDLVAGSKRLMAETSRAAAALPLLPDLFAPDVDAGYTAYNQAVQPALEAYNRQYAELDETGRRLSTLAGKIDMSLPYPAPEPAPPSLPAAPPDLAQVNGRPLPADGATPSAEPPPCAPPALSDHSPDWRWCRWGGKEFQFRAKQAAVVGVLWRAYESGCPDVGHATLLVEAGSDNSRLRDLFRHHPAWGTFIVPGQTRGTARLAPPA